MTLSSQRHLFQIPREVCYLNAAYMTPQTRAIEAAGIDAVKARNTPWEMKLSAFFEPVETVRGQVARLMDCTADDIAIVAAASYAVATAARNLALERGQAILVLEDQFPSNIYGWRRMAADAGAEVVTVRTPADQDWTAAVLGRIEALGDRLALAALPNTHWSTGAFVDLERIKPALDRCGAALFLDLTQSLGAMPFSVRSVDPDFAVAAAYKWLFGPYGMAYMYVAPRHHHGRPLEENWINRAGSEDFARLVEYQDSYQPGARRFDVGERSHFTLMPIARTALEQILDWGVDNIATTIGTINDDISDIFELCGEECIPRKLRSPHILGVKATQRSSSDWARLLKQHHVVASARADYIRIAPHLWVDEGDLETLSKAVNN